MRGNELLDKMELVDPAYVEAADAGYARRRPGRFFGKIAAACLCLAIVGTAAFFGRDKANTVQRWEPGYRAKDYFTFCEEAAEGLSSDKACLDLSALPYDITRWFSDDRETLEMEAVIPVIDTHPLFNCVARYKEDGSLYCVEIAWYRRDTDGLEHYSDLKVVAGYQEVQMIQDCILIEVDDEGHVLEPAVTVTERDGIRITAIGRENTEKTLTFQNTGGWYQISGSWNDDYESVAALLDWFWEHPLDFSRFSPETGDEYTDSTLAEMPDAFAGYLPDFAAFGFLEEASYVSLKNGVPVRFEGHYVAHVSEEQIKDQSFYHVDGYTTMHWCITMEPDIYELEECVGSLEDLTRELVMDILENKDNKIVFRQDDALITVYPKDAAEAWSLIESLRNAS